MSNLIKYPFANLSGKEVYVIDPEKNSKDFTPFRDEETIPLPDLPEEEASATLEEFDEGMNVIDMNEMIYKERQKAEQDAAAILEDAREKAKSFIDTAQMEAESIRALAKEEGLQEGMQLGREQMEQEYAQLEQQCKDEITAHEKEYKQLIEDVEPRYVEVLISLIHKITGVLLEDKSDIILYLIKSSVRGLDKASHYSIRTSSEDAYLVDSRKNEIREILPEEASVEFVEEKSLKANECIIETDTQMVDCGLQTQLTNLEEALRMMVS